MIDSDLFYDLTLIFIFFLCKTNTSRCVLWNSLVTDEIMHVQYLKSEQQKRVEAAETRVTYDLHIL